jgi:hypothetical protein
MQEKSEKIEKTIFVLMPLPAQFSRFLFCTYTKYVIE